jgi:phosphomevalonate kinase
VSALHFRAPGKLLLAGEYAVLGGGLAVVAAVDRYVRASLSAGAKDEPLVIRSMALPGQERVLVLDRTTGSLHGPGSELIAACLERLAQLVGHAWLEALPGGVLTLDSSELSLCLAASGVPVKLGLGSSAASAVALLGILLRSACAHGALAPRRGGTHELARLADAAHRLFQGGVGSGVDVAASALGGMLAFRRRPVFDARPLAIQAGRAASKGVVFWTGRAASTSELLTRVGDWAQHEPAAHQKCMSALSAAAEKLAEAAVPSAVVAAIGQGFDAMRALCGASGIPLVLDAHHELHELARRFGGAAKPTGAGGGDLALAVLPPQAPLEAFLAAAEPSGLERIPLGVSARGFGPVPADVEPKAPGLLEI